MKTTQRRRRTQSGAAFIQMLVLVSSLGLVVGGVMYGTGETLLNTTKQTDESMEASDLGNQRGIQNKKTFADKGSTNAPAPDSQQIDDIPESNPDMGATVPCVPDNEDPFDRTCKKSIWEATVNVLSGVVKGAGDPATQDAAKTKLVENGKAIVKGIGDVISCTFSWTCLSEKTDKAIALVDKAIKTENKWEKIKIAATETAKGIVRAIDNADFCEDLKTCTVDERAKQRGEVGADILTEVALTAAGGALLKGGKLVVKAVAGPKAPNAPKAPDSDAPKTPEPLANPTPEFGQDGDYYTQGIFRDFLKGDFDALPKEGWKMHVSATPGSAGDVAEAVLPYLKANNITH